MRQGEGFGSKRGGWALWLAFVVSILGGASGADAQQCPINRDVAPGTCICPPGSQFTLQPSTCSSGRCTCPANAPNWTGQACTACPGGTQWNGQSCITACQPGTQWNGQQCVSVCQPGQQWNGRQCVSVCQPGTQWNGQQCISVCPPGTRWSGQSCVSTCQQGQVWNGQQCVSMCPPGSRWSGQSCVSTCQQGQVWNGQQCVSMCPGGTQWNGQACVSACPQGQVWNGSSCMAICPLGTEWNGQGCVSKCAAGQQWNGQACVSVCPAGTNWNGQTCVWPENCGGGCGQGQVCVNNACVGTGDLRFTLTWDRPGDVDLRVITPSGREIFYAARAFDNGTLDRDDRVGTGPENIFWSSPPPPGTYLVCVDPYRVAAPTNFTLMITSSGQPPRIINGVRTPQQRSGSCSRNTPGFVTEFVVGQGQPACPPGTNYNRASHQCECPAGAQWNGIMCVGGAATCPPGTSYNPQMQRCECPAGTQWNGQSCGAVQATCPAGTQWNGQMCAAPQPTCPAGTQWNGQTCAAPQPTCPAGMSWNGQMCVAAGGGTDCPAGTQWNGQSCAPASSFSWVAPRRGRMPQGAVQGGYEADRQPLYVCRASYNGGVHVGKVVGPNCNIGWGGAEVLVPTFEVLVGAGGRWVAASQGYVPPGALQGGQEADGRPLFVCRASHNGGVHVGKVVGQSCNIGWGGTEVLLPSYEVLLP